MTESATCPAQLVTDTHRTVTTMREAAPSAGAGQWPQEVREAVIDELDAILQDLTLYRGQVLLAHKDEGRWGSVRDRDFADYRSRKTGTGRGAATGELQLAEGLRQMPDLADAVEEGRLNVEHAKAMSRLRRTGSQEVQGALDAGGLQQLIQRAGREKLTAPELDKAAKAWAATIDAAAAQASFDAVRRRRSLTMRKSAGGVAGEFFLDPVAGEQLRTAMEAIAGRPAADDDRTREQRMADALTTVAERTLQVGSDLGGAQVRPHISLLVSEQTWAGILARRRAFETCPDGPRPPLPEVAPGELEDGTIVPLGELERLMCDSEITRMVLDAAGIPLDVGRTQRTYTKELRRAVTTRDRHCQWPGCRLRASWCQVHHITWFSRGGVTSLEEGISLCNYHHHRVHEFAVRITRLADGFDFHHHDGTRIGTTRRGEPPGGRLVPEHRRSSGRPETPEGRVGAGGREATGTPPASDGLLLDPRPPDECTSDVPVAAQPPPTTVPPPPVPPPRNTGPAVAGRAPLPRHPGTYASAPALWDSDPPL